MKSLPLAVIAYLSLFLSFIFSHNQLYSQCSTEYMFAGGGASCTGSANLYVDVWNDDDYDFYEQISHFRWYKKSGTGSWQYLGQTTADYGMGNYSTTVGYGTTIFGVSYYNQDYWCESGKVEISVTRPSPPSAWAEGSSCSYGQATIQAHSSTSGVTFYLYKYENYQYYSRGSNTSGSFSINDYYEQDAHNYYVRAQKSGCWSGYSNVYIEDLSDLNAPTVTGNTVVCNSGSRILTASGGTEGNYRWYNSSNQLISGATGSTYNTGNITSSKTYKVSYIEQGMMDLGCESPKATVTVPFSTTPSPPTAYTAMGKVDCHGSSVTLTASTGHTRYQWRLPG